MTEFYDVARDANNKPIPQSLGTNFAQLHGRFKSYTPAGGTSSVVASYDADGYLTAVTRTDSATGQSEEFVYAYAPVTNDLVTAAHGPVPQLVANVTLQRLDASGAWQPVQRVEYTYYTGRIANDSGGWQNDPNGRLGDLQLVQVENPVPTADGSVTWQEINTSYYRYYKLTGEGGNASQGPTNNATTTGGPNPIQPAFGTYNPSSPGTYDMHVFSGLKTVVDGAAFDQMAAAVPNYQSASDSALQPYVNNFFQYERWDDHIGADGFNGFGSNAWNTDDLNYDWRTGYRAGTKYRVIEEIAQGAGCSLCSGGQGTYKYEYTANYDATGIGYNVSDYNIWRMKTTEYLPSNSAAWGDHDREVVYTDVEGQPLLEVYVQVGGGSEAISGMKLTGSPSSSGETITVMAPNHGFNTGDVVAISGVEPELFNGVFAVTRIDANTFSFTVPYTYTGPPAEPSPFLNQIVNGSQLQSTVTKVLRQSETFFRYDNQGRLILKASPSAVNGYNDNQPDLLLKDSANHYSSLYDHQGLIELTDYYDSTTATETTPGGVAGYYQDTKIEQGQLGTPVLQQSQQYYVHRVDSQTVDVTVTTPQGTSATSQADQFTYVEPQAPASPEVTGLGPASGLIGGGESITLVGSHFTGARAVFFGTTPASGLQILSDSQLTVTVPAHAAGVVDVTVITASGTSATTSADEFTYVTRPAPVLVGIGPASGLVQGGNSVTLVGSGLSGVSAVFFGTTPAASLQYYSDNQITAVAPAHAAGVVDITVVTPSGTSAISPADQFTYVTRPAPAVAGIGAPSGRVQGGDSVTLVGSSFTGASAVLFGTTPASNFYVQSDNVITATTPAHAAGVVDVTVITPSGPSALSTADQFTYVTTPPSRGVPVVTGVGPASGFTPGGERITLVGSSFTNASAVYFGTTKTSAFQVDSDGQITVYDVPAHAAGVVDITVVTPLGTSATSAADQYTYVTRPVPVVNGLSPASGLNLGGGRVTLVGSSFTGATAVYFGTTPTTAFQVDSDNQLTVYYVPAHAAGVVDVTVVTPSGTSATSVADEYTYLAPLPAVTALAPDSGPSVGGGRVILVGSGFTGATAVHFGATSASAFQVDSDNQITIYYVPAHAAGLVDITVTTPSGTSAISPADQFTYVGPAPAVTGLGPPAGVVAGGDRVIVIGSHFTGATVVSFGGTSAPNISVDSDSQITVYGTPPHAAGVVDVTVTTPSGKSPPSAADQFTYGASQPPPGVPTVSGLAPISGSVAGGGTVTIVGSTFTNATAVSFGGLSALSVKVLSSSVITAVVPARTVPTVYPVATSTVYRNGDGTGAETTSYAYTWFANSTRMQSQVVTKPVISADQNGPGVADTETTVYDLDGRPIWQQDGDGFLNYTAYDPATGVVSKNITDVDTTRTGDFQDLPAGWATPPGGGRHLITTYEIDALGRTTALTDPNGNVTYTVYDDPNHEVRTYAGWQASIGMPTGPTLVTRVDRTHSPGYTETLTMAAPPHLTNGRPDGTEPISDVQSLSRTLTSPGGQVVETDQYFSLDGVSYSTDPSLGSAGTNYYAMQYAYNDRGWLDRIITPTGTIERAIYDGQGRLVSTWIGTDDTPASGYWSPDNNTAPSNMVEVSALVYDNGGVGDGDLTQRTDFPGGGAAPRVTQNFYDWRDRLAASKQGVQDNQQDGTNRPIRYTTYDNLNEIVLVQQYEGDGVSIHTADGVPQPPDASLLRAQTAYSYDDQGRVYQQLVYDVDPSTGAVSSTALTTNDYYDPRGDRIAQSDPGGLWTKDVYDGAGRLVLEYATDGGGGTSWAAAASVANDIVLQQTETIYDGNDNAIETIDRQRFHNATGTGALGDPSSTTAPQARVYYTGSYHDAADRLTATVDVGTNGGAAWVRPDTIPDRSDTELVTNYTYNAAGWVQDTTDPRSLDTHTEYDLLGRTVETIANYTGNTETNNSDVATLYRYDGDNHLLAQTAVQPAGTPSQTTEYVYGVSPASGSALASNDLLGATLYPDPATGQPSLQQQESYTYNALGQVTSMTDRNGTTHQYGFDVLGRQTSDTVASLAAGVDGSVLRLDTAYDGQGNPYLFTSYADTAGTVVVNQDEDLYNGLGQLTALYQSHSGPVVIGTTPAVQYTYNEMANGENNSRLTSMIYPDGRVIQYNYDPGLDDSISRLSSLSGATGVLEAYSYLGVDTVVERAHPQTGVNLTYLSPTGTTGDAGDPYTGLDRFGRVVEQLWLNANTGTASDDFQYTYDRDGNVLTQNNSLNPAFNEQYSYDGLNQLTGFTRGPQTETWNLDALGNWSSVTMNGATQTRTANAQNQYTSVSGGTTSGYDNNGNLTTDPTNGTTYIYDAWNRLVAVGNGSTRLASYSYDALGRRITETSTATLDLYISKDWQVVEERSGGVMQTQYVWSPVYTDALVERDTSDGTRLYAQQDANWNVTAVVDGNGTVQERYVYDPYGQVTILAADWSSRTGSSLSWIYLHQGGRLDTASGLYGFRNRDYSPVLGRWLQQDPSTLLAGDANLYRYVANDPVATVDWSGLGPSIGDRIWKWAKDQAKKWGQSQLDKALYEARNQIGRDLTALEAALKERQRLQKQLKKLRNQRIARAPLNSSVASCPPTQAERKVQNDLNYAQSQINQYNANIQQNLLLLSGGNTGNWFTQKGLDDRVKTLQNYYNDYQRLNQQWQDLKAKYPVTQ